MAVSVNFYSFDKRINSTKRPASGDIVTTVSCVFKAPTDVMTPTLVLVPPTGVTMPALTYAYIPTWGKYYFVRGWRVLINEMWECDLEEDVLATFKSEIGSASRYVLRSASSSDGSIMDTVYPTIGGRKQLTTTGSTSPYSTSGCYIIGVIGAGSGYNQGAVQYYVMDGSSLQSFMTAMLGDPSWMGISAADMAEELVKGLINPFQYIASAMWMPVTIAQLAGVGLLDNVSVMKFGWWDLSFSTRIIDSQSPSYTSPACTFSISKHPKAATRGTYLNLSPYSEYEMFVSGFGNFQIDSTLLDGGSYIRAYIDFDLIAGYGMLRMDVLDSNSQLLRHLPPRCALLGVPVQLAQITSQMGQQFLSGAAGIAGAALTGNIGGVIANLGSAIVGTAASALAADVSSTGTNGSLVNYITPTYRLDLHYFAVADQDLTELGAPLCQTVTINTLSGYVLCADGDLNISAYDVEKDKIRNFLKAGFFYE